MDPLFAAVNQLKDCFSEKCMLPHAVKETPKEYNKLKPIILPCLF